MHAALTGLDELLESTLGDVPAAAGAGDYLQAVRRDVAVARGAIGIVLSRARIPSLLVDNLNASVHLRALLTDLFLLEQAARTELLTNRKSTRLNSSHVKISYAVFCLKKKSLNKLGPRP